MTEEEKRKRKIGRKKKVEGKENSRIEEPRRQGQKQLEETKEKGRQGVMNNHWRCKY